MPARHSNIVDSRFLNYMASHDLASNICQALDRGVTRSKRSAMQWTRKVAENGCTKNCYRLAVTMYGDHPYAREIGHVVEAVASSAGFMEGHDIPPDVMTGVLHWLRMAGESHLVEYLDMLRTAALEGAKHCRNEMCEVMGLLKDFKVCPQCKTARYCGDACQKQDWNAGGHKAMCGKFNDTGKHRQVY